MLKAVIFDMDGVLVDSEPIHFAANEKFMREKFGIKLEYEDYRGFIGSTVKKIWNFYREKYSLYEYTWEELMEAAEAELYRMVEKSGYPAVEGAAETVRELFDSGYMLAVASSSPMEKIERNLRQLGLSDLFQVKVSGMEVKNPKPSPDIFLKAAELLHVNTGECIVIEDSRNGVMAAKAAGMACLGFINPNSGNQDLSSADYLFESFEAVDEPFVRMVHNHCFRQPWTVIETERLRIREMSVDDIDAIISMYSHPEITEYMEGLYDREEELKYMEQYIEKIYGFYGYGMWIVELKDGTVIGRAGIEFYENMGRDENRIIGIYRACSNVSEGAECSARSEKYSEQSAEDKEYCHILGYVIGKEYQNKGYGYEAVSGILKYAAENLGIEEIKVSIHKDNIKSLKLAQKLGFKLTAGTEI